MTIGQRPVVATRVMKQLSLNRFMVVPHDSI